MLVQADAYRIPLPDQSVHCVVCSPPYWGLRRYSGEQGRGEFPNLGLEETPEEHIERIVQIFREVRRVLRDDGMVWLNYGDCYASTTQGGTLEFGNPEFNINRPSRKATKLPAKKAPIKQGNLMLMPHRVAIALQDDGWVVRNDLIWFKRNPMPESVAGWRWEKSRTKKGRSQHAKEHNIKGGTEAMLRDASIHQGIGPHWVPEYEYGDDYVLRQGSWRHTRAHEYIFQLVKDMQYYSNQEAVREPHLQSSIKRAQSGWDGNTQRDYPGQPQLRNRQEKMNTCHPSGRNPRSVLDVPTAPYKGAHYATFPPNLIAPLIRASCPRRSCPECGQAWAPVVDTSQYVKSGHVEAHHHHKWADMPNQELSKTSSLRTGLQKSAKVIDYRPTCEHNHDPIPGIVLDPFIGSGTTGAVAHEIQRRWIGLDISMDYIDNQAKPRALGLTPSNALDGLPLFDYEP